MESPVFSAIDEFVTQLSATDCTQKQVQMTIDGLVYTSTKLPASQGLELMPAIGRLLGPLAQPMATGEAGSFSVEAIIRILDKAAADGVLPITKTLLGRMQCSKLASTGQGGFVLSDFDEHFAGEYPHLLKVVAFSLAHNFKGFTRGRLSTQ